MIKIDLVNIWVYIRRYYRKHQIPVKESFKNNRIIQKDRKIMKITHICLCGTVTDHFSYQDNLLPKYHKRLGHDVSVITSRFVRDNKGMITTDERSPYLNEYGIKTIRLDQKFGKSIRSLFRRYKYIYETMENEKPDILFIHGFHFIDILRVAKYLKENKTVTAYIDNHADFSNSAMNWATKNMLHKLIWRQFALLIEPYIKKFYGVLPARVDFLTDMYKIPKDKVELLLMGADDDKVNEAKPKEIRNTIRRKYGINPGDFLIITGGKLDTAKRQTLLLMKAVHELNRDDVKLIVFGSVIKELRAEFEGLCDGHRVQYIGWINSDESYQYFASAELAVFPGRHSVFWEQVVGLGIPMVVKYWQGTTHIDLGGNCSFLYHDTVGEILSVITKITSEPDIYENMRKKAMTKSRDIFLYSNIALKSISK